MDIPINAAVECADGACGRSAVVIINPIDDEVTHVVVREPGLFGPDRMVPVDFVTESGPDRIRLRCSKGELDGMQPFTKSEFVDGPPELTGYAAGAGMLWPYLSPSSELVPIECESVPPQELAIHRWARVEATDGHIGRVDAFLVSPINGHITHLVLRTGHLWGQRDVTIPLGEIDRIEDDSVSLRLSKEQVGALPSIPVG